MEGATALRHELQTSFIPNVEARGFIQDESQQPEFLIFRRCTEDSIQVFDVQWDTHGRTRFTINFGDAPLVGLKRYGEPISATEVMPSDCHPVFQLGMGCGTSADWFDLRPNFIRRTFLEEKDHSPEEVVSYLLKYFGEMEEWWSERKIGAHMQSFLL